MVTAARGRPVIEMGSRRANERAAVAAARAAYLAGFAFTSNLAAGRAYGIPTTGTAAHAFTLLHQDEQTAFASQVAALGKQTTLLVDTYDIDQGIRNAIAVAGPDLRAIRIDSGDLSVLAGHSRALLDSLGARRHEDRRLRRPRRIRDRRPGRRAGRRLRRRHGRGHRLRRADRRPGLQARRGRRSPRGEAQREQGDGRRAENRSAADISRRVRRPRRSSSPKACPTTSPATRCCSTTSSSTGLRSEPVTLAASREHLREALISIPWEGLKLSAGDPAHLGYRCSGPFQ